MASIRLENLVKSFGETVQAVRGVSLEIADGEFVVLVGPSGCGKTTTLHLIAGLERPTSGEVWIGAERVTDWEPGDRNLGVVFQSLALFPHMTVFDNIAFPLMIKKVPPAELGERVRGVATTLHVAHLLDKRPSTLSGGEAQRVALARTIVVKPAAFLMDEPLSSLDAKLRVEMRTELKRLHATLRATFVYVTHDQAEAMTMAHRIVVMDQGRVQQTGPPLAIYNEPANYFVAGFFGIPAMNFIDGELHHAACGSVFQAPALRLALTRSGPSAGGPATLGVRPEHVRLSDGAEGWPAAVASSSPWVTRRWCSSTTAEGPRSSPRRARKIGSRWATAAASRCARTSLSSSPPPTDAVSPEPWYFPVFPPARLGVSPNCAAGRRGRISGKRSLNDPLWRFSDENVGHRRKGASRQTGESRKSADARVGRANGQAPHRPRRGEARHAAPGGGGHGAPAVPHEAPGEVAPAPAHVTRARAPDGSRRQRRELRRPRVPPVAAWRPASRARPNPG